MTKEVVAKRGCTCCGTGCVLPAVLVPGLAFTLSGALGLVVALVVSLPATLAVMHGVAWVDRHRAAR